MGYAGAVWDEGKDCREGSIKGADGGRVDWVCGEGVIAVGYHLRVGDTKVVGGRGEAG